MEKHIITKRHALLPCDAKRGDIFTYENGYMIFERNVGAHNLRGKCEDGHGWFMNEEGLSIFSEPYSDNPNDQKYEV